MECVLCALCKFGIIMSAAPPYWMAERREAAVSCARAWLHEPQGTLAFLHTHTHTGHSLGNIDECSRRESLTEAQQWGRKWIMFFQRAVREPYVGIYSGDFNAETSQCWTTKETHKSYILLSLSTFLALYLTSFFPCYALVLLKVVCELWECLYLLK